MSYHWPDHVSGLSESGRFRLDARRSDQDRYHYRFWDREKRRYLWEHRQADGEPYPEEFLISDDGHAVVFQHSPLFSPEIRVFNKRGELTIWLSLGAEKAGSIRWDPGDLEWTSRGEMWGGGAWRMFCHHQQAHYHSLRLKSGQRLLLRLHPEPRAVEPDAELNSVLEALEKAELLRAARDDYKMPENMRPLLALAMTYRTLDTVDFLRKIEAQNYQGRSVMGPCLQFAGGVSFAPEKLYARQILRRLGQTPSAGPGYVFDGQDQPEHPHDRASKLAQLTPLLSPTDVLEWVGPPDHITNNEAWEYDEQAEPGRWVTTFLLWGGQPHTCTLIAIESAPADWQSREAELLQFWW